MNLSVIKRKTRYYFECFNKDTLLYVFFTKNRALAFTFWKTAFHFKYNILSEYKVILTVSLSRELDLKLLNTLQGTSFCITVRPIPQAKTGLLTQNEDRNEMY